MKTSKRKASWFMALLTLMSAAAIAETTPTPEPASGATPMAADAEGRYSYIIEFREPELLRHSNRRSGEPVDLRSASMMAARNELMAVQARHVEDISARLDRAVEPTHHFLATENGIAARLTEEEASRVAALDAVKAVRRTRAYSLDTFNGPTFIGADTIWDGSAVPGGSALLGEGMVAAILDSGIPDPNTHDSFANVSACGHGGGNPDKVISALDCSSTDGTGLCNGASPFDTDGHGSHTSSTVAGNTVDGSSTPPANPPAGFSELSGVAPCAHIRSYKVCPSGSCPGTDILAGMESVLLHGDVDVMNFSISGGSDPWNDFDSIKLDLVDADIFVAASAGNTSTNTPDPVGQVNHRGPWVMSVAASTRSGDFVAELLADGRTMDADPGSDSPVGSSLNDYPITYDPSQPSGNEGCVSFPADFFVDSIALVQRGGCAFTDKINNAAAAGADMVIIWNNTGGTIGMLTPGQDPNTPAYSITQSDGQFLINLIDDGAGSAPVDFNVLPLPGDILAGFSFRGPTPSPLQDLQKPDITGPGVDILAAIPDGYGRISGTSMSSPHVAGAAVLVRQAHPDWTPSEVKSALQMTAVEEGFKEDGTTPWDWDDVGSGRVDLSAAALAGVVMDESVADYLAADPASGGDVKTLNLPGLRNLSCKPQCSWQRTLRNTLGSASSWTVTTASANPDVAIQVSPSTFSFTGDTAETVTLTITAVPQADLSDTIAFGEVVLTEDTAQAPEAHLTVAVSGSTQLFSDRFELQ